MKPVHQTDFTREGGNCFSACLASLLELPVEKVPTFRPDPDGRWIYQVQAWLAQYGLYAVDVSIADGMPIAELPQGLAVILSGRSPNLEGADHSVIARIDKSSSHPEYCLWDFVHDPNPSGKFLAGRPTGITFLAKLDPAIRRTPKIVIEPLRPQACRQCDSEVGSELGPRAKMVEGEI